MKQAKLILLLFIATMLWSSVSIYKYEVVLLASTSCCGASSEKNQSCCSKVEESLSCCSKSNEKEQRKSCNGNCKGKSCKCVTHLVSSFVFKEAIRIPEIVYFAAIKKFTTKNEFSISLDYSFIWAPPKIA